jgi:hypothetical protein
MAQYFGYRQYCLRFWYLAKWLYQQTDPCDHCAESSHIVDLDSALLSKSLKPKADGGI